MLNKKRCPLFAHVHAVAKVPARFVIGLMVFLATTFAYMLSFNFSINLLAMVHTYDSNGTQLPQPNVSTCVVVHFKPDLEPQTPKSLHSTVPGTLGPPISNPYWSAPISMATF